jgi:hypothetical protein
MKTKFKTFENNIEIKDRYYWIIYGNYREIINILKYFSKYLYLYEDRLKYDDSILLSSALLHKSYTDRTNISGTILSYDDAGKFAFYNFENNDDRDEILKESYSSYDFRGEIKLKNDEIFLDTIEIYIKKYNL